MSDTTGRKQANTRFQKGHSGNPNGRPKGSGNKFTKDISEMLEDNQSPLEYMLEVMNNTDNEQRERLDAAKAAAPYIHARISYIDMNVETESIRYVISAQPISEEEFNEKYCVETADQFN